MRKIIDHVFSMQPALFFFTLSTFGFGKGVLSIRPTLHASLSNSRHRTASSVLKCPATRTPSSKRALLTKYRDRTAAFALQVLNRVGAD
ncbi:MAG: hypothetical protein NXY57DRAFT_550365 [Lentinula lateritia]|uniref:Secreted protein n=1 Tax=Lentinula lateritia TaxID=40482 RepID=A0ABQ8V8Q9_9AGAR|nr:MAG: hypothetical protein NXY57DRAFT_550365 [Lentinula lateritia]KAJ4471215.1 hypothetical protein C8R41DRAFT_850810 [Lentinula lateritia]